MKPLSWPLLFAIIAAVILFLIRTAVLAVQFGFLEWLLRWALVTVLAGGCLAAMVKVIVIRK